MKLETKRWTKFVSTGSHLSGGAKTGWREYLHLIKVTPSKKTRKKYI